MILPPWAPEATEPEICELLAALVMVRQPRIIAEAGTYRGHAALLMADACRRIGAGHVQTFDPVDHGIREYIEANDLSAWITYTQGPYEIPTGVEFAFIDASARDPDGRMNAGLRWVHWSETAKKLAPGGLMCAHDTRAGEAPWHDHEGGASMHRIRDMAQLNLDAMRGLSIYKAP